MKKMKYVLLLGVFCLAACAKEPEVPGKDPTQVPVREETVTPEATQEPEATSTPVPTKQPEVQKETVLPMQLFAETEQLREWEEGRLLCDVGWQTLALGEAETLKYPELAKVLEEKGKDSRSAGEASFAELLPLARELDTLMGEGWGCKDVNSFYVQRADETILSVRADVVYDAGSIHPMSSVSSFNLNPKTGEELALGDVVKDVPKVLDEVKRLLEEEHGEFLFDDWKEILANYTEMNYVWTMDYQGLTFYFSPYEVGPWSSGLLTVFISFDAMPEMFEDVYNRIPEAGWAKEVPFGSLVALDRNREDGKLDYFAIHQTRMYEDDDKLAFEFLLNGNYVFEQELYAYEFKTYLVCLGEAGEEKYYLYVDSTHENDNHVLYVLDFNGNRITEIEAQLGGGFHTVYDEEGYGADEVFLNPEELKLDFRMDMMRTNLGTLAMYVDENGLPAAKTDYYELDVNQSPLVAKIPVEVILLAGNTKEIVAAGTEFRFLRTDNKTYVDFLLPDGRECRVEVDNSQWPRTVNGVSEEECFDGIGYAG